MEVEYVQDDNLTTISLGWVEIPTTSSLMEARAHHFMTL
jgi:hypothetical protein